MTVKQYLYSVRDEQKEIEELDDRIRELRMSLLPGAIRYDKDKVQSSPEDALSRRTAEVVDYEQELADRMRMLTLKRQKAQEMIDTLEDSRERQALGLYFLSIGRPSMTKVAEKMGYTQRQTFRFYVSGLEHLQNAECH